MRMRTDAFVNRNFGRRPHSEDKKPYFDDIDYPEMEHFFFGWDPPSFPPFDPVFPPDNPEEEEPYPYGRPGRRFEWKQGCKFIPPRFDPYIIKPGDYARTVFVIGENDDIRGIRPVGPIEVITKDVELRKCHEGAGLAKCELVIRAKKDIGDYAGPDLIPALVFVDVASDYDCFAQVMVQACESEHGPEWDYSLNPQTASPPDQITIYLVADKGQPPFKWSIVGRDCSLAASETQVWNNTLNLGENFCGSAVITIIDDCGRKTSGAVRSTAGKWAGYWENQVQKCQYPGPYTSWWVTDELIDPATTVRVINNQRYYQFHDYSHASWLQCPGPPDKCHECLDYCKSSPRCAHSLGCSLWCITNHPMQCQGGPLCYHGYTFGCPLCDDGSLGRTFCICVEGAAGQTWECDE